MYVKIKKMMKKTFTLLSLFALLVGMNQVNAELIAQNVTTYITGPNDQLMTAHVTIVNNGANAAYVKVVRLSEVLAPHHVSYFCWTECYDPTVSLSPDSILLASGESTSIFNGDLSPQLTDGISIVSYAFFTSNGDSVFATFTYEALTTGINEFSSQPVLHAASPNPADGFTKISYNLNSSRDAKIVIYNVLGSAVKEIKLNDVQNTLTISTADFKQGVYFYSLVVDGKAISSKRLMISHR